MHQTTFLWFKSNTAGLYFNILDYTELIIYVVIILTTFIACILLLLANDVKRAIKVFLIGVLSITLPMVLLYDAHYRLLTHPMRDIAWYQATHGATVAVILCFIPMFIFFPYSIVMIVMAVRKIIKKHKHNKV